MEGILDNFKTITTKRQFIDLRLSLEKTFILFFAYSETQDNSEWFDVLSSLQSEFKEHLQVVLFTDKSEDKLLMTVKKDNEEKLAMSEIDLPRAVLCHPHLTEPELLTDLEPYTLYKSVEDASEFYKNKFEDEKASVFTKIEKILSSFPIVVFIKGTPHDPFCKFSKSFIAILKQADIKYKSFDIFRDDSLRSYLRLYSGWKTYPQLYVKGKILGGVDILKDLVDKGEFAKLVPYECTRDAVRTTCQEILKENSTVIFGEGQIENSEISQHTKEALYSLDSKKINYKFVDMLKDEMIRDVVKEVSKCETFPQVFSKGQYIGGLQYLKDHEIKG